MTVATNLLLRSAGKRARTAIYLIRIAGRRDESQAHERILDVATTTRDQHITAFAVRIVRNDLRSCDRKTPGMLKCVE